jgi:hypothetical protein
LIKQDKNTEMYTTDVNDFTFNYYPTDTHEGVELKAKKLLLSAQRGVRADRYAFRPCIQKKHPV